MSYGQCCTKKTNYIVCWWFDQVTKAYVIWGELVCVYSCLLGGKKRLKKEKREKKRKIFLH